MAKILALSGVAATDLRVEFGWSWSDMAFGYCRTFEELGMTALVLGPLHIQFEWEI
jgi:hypothetical protein